MRISTGLAGVQFTLLTGRSSTSWAANGELLLDEI
jgi:hypothetical protein